MCIRDRLIIVFVVGKLCHHAGKSTKAGNIQVLLVVFLNLSKGLFQSFLCAEDSWLVNIIPEADSYTHLDVYKRQGVAPQSCYRKTVRSLNSPTGAVIVLLRSTNANCLLLRLSRNKQHDCHKNI